MRVIGLVAVRMKSSRLLRKALLDLNGRPLIIQLLSRLKRSNTLDDIVLCTSTNPDDSVLLDIAKENGHKAFAGSEDDVMDRFLKAGWAENADIIVRITGDNPLTDPQAIDLMVESHINNKADYTRMDGLPIGVTAEVINFDALKKAFKLAEDSGFSEYMTYYFVDYPNIFSLNIINAPEEINRPGYRLTVDYPEDYELIKTIFGHFGQMSDVSLEKIVRYLDENPEIAGINSEVEVPAGDLFINTRLKTG